MIPEYSASELQTWLESRNYEIGRFTQLGILCQRITDEVPQMIQAYLADKKSIELGDWVYYDEFGKIVRTGPGLKKYEKENNPDNEVVLIREKTDGTKIEISRLDLKIANGEVEFLLKPDFPIFKGY